MTNALLEQRREQMFPKLTPAQIARLERQGTRLQTHEGEVLTQPGHDVETTATSVGVWLALLLGAYIVGVNLWHWAGDCNVPSISR